MNEALVKTVSERVKEFQSNVMLHLIVVISGIILGVNLMGGNIFTPTTNEELLNTLVATIIVITLMKLVVRYTYKEFDFIGTYGTFGYKDYFYEFYVGTNDIVEKAKLEKKMVARISSIATLLILMGVLMLNMVGGSMDSWLIPILALIVVVFFYTITYRSLGLVYSKYLEVPIYKTIYQNMVDNNEIKAEDYPKYIEWVKAEIFYSIKKFTKEENRRYSTLHERVEDESMGVIIYVTETVLLNKVTWENKEEIEKRLERRYHSEGYEVEVDLTQLIKYDEQQELNNKENNKEDNKDKREEPENGVDEG